MDSFLKNELEFLQLQRFHFTCDKTWGKRLEALLY